MNDSVSIPTWFKVVAGIALLWNLLGVALFYMDATMAEEAMTDAQRAFKAAAPAWFVWVYGAAVIAGAIGCVLLLLRRAAAFPVLVVSLTAVLIQFGYVYGATDAWHDAAGAQIGVSVLVIFIGAGLVWLSSDAKGKGWMS